MTASLCGAFLVSGAAALVFESLWFRLSGLALESSLWASTAVLASFMTGLALGNLLAARRGEHVRRPHAAGLLAGAFLGGAILLGLEVVWFRLLQVFVFGTQLAFALMLVVVLAGIGIGGLAGAAWLKRRPGATSLLAVVPLAGGIAAILAYASLEPSRVPDALAGGEASRTLWLSEHPILPTSLVSGVLFTLLGTALRSEVDGDAADTGWLTLANTLGAALGAPLAGLVLLLWLGTERSIVVLAAAYALVGAALAPWCTGRAQAALVGAAASFALVAALFPFGLMSRRFVRGVMAVPPAVLPKHAVPWRSWLVERLRVAAGARSPVAQP